MNFSLNSLNEDNLRTGNIHANENSFSTPLCLLYSKSSSVPYLSNEVLKVASFSKSILQVFTNHFYENRETIKKFQKGVKEFTGIDNDSLSFCMVQDSLSLSPAGYNNSAGVAIWSRNGKTMLNCNDYMSFLEDMKPDIFECLSVGDIDELSSKKKIEKSVDYTLEYLDATLDWLENYSERRNKVGIFGVIVGGWNIQERIRCAMEINKKNVQGFIVDGFISSVNSCVQDIFSESICIDIFKSILKILPEDKPRMLKGSYSPPQILEAYNLGFDIFEGLYPYSISEKGYVFSIDWNNDGQKSFKNSLLRLKDIKFAEEFIPIQCDCECLTCNEYTRAYIYHLFKCSEILANILIIIHNLFQFEKFMCILRKKVTNGEFEAFKKFIFSIDFIYK